MLMFVAEKVYCILAVMTMEAQAESINQLTTDELEGKVQSYLSHSFFFFCNIFNHLHIFFSSQS